MKDHHYFVPLSRLAALSGFSRYVLFSWGYFLILSNSRFRCLLPSFLPFMHSYDLLGSHEDFPIYIDIIPLSQLTAYLVSLAMYFFIFLFFRAFEFKP